MTVAIAGYVSKQGLYHVFTTSTVINGEFTNITAIPINPTFTRNGSSDSVTGPFWRDSKHDCPFVCYRPTTPIVITDVVTMDAPIAWVTTSAGAGPAVAALLLPNYLGQLEPGMGTYGGRTYPGFNFPSSSWTMPLGYNSTHGGRAIYYAQYFPFANTIRRMTVGATGTAIKTMDAHGNPLTLNSTVSLEFLQPDSAGWPDGRGSPSIMGDYIFIADESAPLTPMTVSLACQPAVSVSAPVITGTGAGKSWRWTCSYPAGNLGSFNTTMTIKISGTGAGGSGNWTLGTNFQFLQPNNTTRSSNPFKADTNFLNWVTTPGGHGPAVMRWVDAVIGSDGISTQVEPVDQLDTLQPFWNSAGYSIPVSNVRNFDPVRSPFVYWSQQWTNATTPGGGPPGAPYALPTSAGFLNFSGVNNTTWAMGECVFDNTKYQLKSGQSIHFSNGAFPAGIPCTNGNKPNINVNLNNVSSACFLTGPNTFAFTWAPSAPGTSSSVGMPGNINNIVGDNAVTGLIGLTAPNDQGGIGYEPTANVTGQMPGPPIYWLSIPVMATDAFVTAAAVKVFANYPASGVDSSLGAVLIEYSNELWSNIQSRIIAFTLSSTNALGTASFEGAVAIRIGQIYKLVKAAAVSVGWNGRIIRNFSVQYSFSQITTNYINFLNSYNVAHPTDQIGADCFSGAPYMPSAIVADSTMNAACASVYSTNAASTQFGNLNPFTRSQWWDLYRHFMLYNTFDNGPNGRIQGQITAISHYVPTTDQGPGFVPDMRGYEGGTQNVYTSATATGSGAAAMNLQFMHDLMYDPEIQFFDLAQYLGWQFGGFKSVNIYGLSIARIPANCWPVYTWNGQLAGPGDGSTGVTNLFFSDTHRGQDYTNQSVRGYMWNRWNDAGGTPTNVTATGGITLHSLAVAGAGSAVGGAVVGSGSVILAGLGVSSTTGLSVTGSGAITLAPLTVASVTPSTTGIWFIFAGNATILK